MNKLNSSGSTEDKVVDDGNGDEAEGRDGDVVGQGCATLFSFLWPSSTLGRWQKMQNCIR